MAIQTLNTIKDLFRTGLKPTQIQFWDTWDSFRHKNEKVSVGDVEGIYELLDSKTDESDFKTINGESIIGNGNIEISGTGSGNKQEYVAKISPSDNFVTIYQDNIGSVSIERVQPYAYSIIIPDLTQMSKVIIDVSLDSNTDINDNRTIDYKTGNNTQGQIILLMRQNNVLQAYSSEQAVDISLKITLYK